jgi:hypothetical protein
MNVAPGDLIEWVYKHNNVAVHAGETAWSSPDSRWVPIGSDLVHVCIGIKRNCIVWLNERGLFRMKILRPATFSASQIYITAKRREL